MMGSTRVFLMFRFHSSLFVEKQERLTQWFSRPRQQASVSVPLPFELHGSVKGRMDSNGVACVPELVSPVEWISGVQISAFLPLCADNTCRDT